MRAVPGRVANCCTAPHDGLPKAQPSGRSPSELNAARTNTPSPAAAGDSSLPGDPAANSILSPSQLGFDGRFSNLFGGNKTETAPFKGEPTRDTLTQPPPGYQTPSPNFAYGTGPKESLNKEYNPAQGKYGE